MCESEVIAKNMSLSSNDKAKLIEDKERGKLFVRNIMTRYKCGKTQM